MKHGITVSHITNAAEFAEPAYPVYCSFYHRTHYGFRSDRVRKEAFRDWVRTLFQFPEVVVLAASTPTEMVAFSICFLVDDVIIGKSLVTSDKALDMAASDALYHACRMAARESSATLIYEGLMNQNPGLNKFKVDRGARILALPSIIRAPDLLLQCMHRFIPNGYSRMVGTAA
jgi:hypothetical protein